MKYPLNLISGFIDPLDFDSLSNLADTLDEHERARAQSGTGINYRVGDVLLGLYQIVQQFHPGGQGVVYLVQHLEWNMLLAMKVPKKSIWADELSRKRYIRESETWIGLGKHPNIATAFYLKEIDGIPHIFTEFADAGTLLQWNQKTSDSQMLNENLDILIQILDGLTHAHRAGIVHCDIKPANILLWRDRTAKITDFGLARNMGDFQSEHGSTQLEKIDSIQSSGNEILGTPEYMSPEQWQNHEIITRATDIYTFGLLVSELLTGKHPLDLTGHAKRVPVSTCKQRHLNSIPDRISKYLPNIPEELDNLIQACLEKQSQDRPDNLDALREQLIKFYESQIGYGLYPRQKPDAVALRVADLNNRGISFIDLGLKKDARHNLEQALQIDPQNPEALYNIILFKWREGEITDDEVINEMEQAISVVPDAVYHLGLFHLNRGDLVSAEKKFIKALQFPQYRGSSLKYLGVILLGMGEYESSLDTLLRARDILPFDLELSKYLREANSLTGTQKSEVTHPLKLGYTVSGMKGANFVAKVIGVDFQSQTAVIKTKDNILAEIGILDGQIRKEYGSYDGERLIYLGDSLLLIINYASHDDVRGNVWNIRAGTKVSEHRLTQEILLDYSDSNRFGYKDGDLYFIAKGTDRLRFREFVAVCKPDLSSPIPLILTGNQISTFLLDSKNSVIVTGSDKGHIQFWNFGGTWPCGELVDHKSRIRYLGIKETDTENTFDLISCSDDKTIRLWKISRSYSSWRGECIRVFEGHTSGVGCADMNITKNILVSYGTSNEDGVRFWDAHNGICQYTSKINTSYWGRLGFLTNDTAIFYDGNPRQLEGAQILICKVPDQTIKTPFLFSTPKTTNESTAIKNEVESARLQANQSQKSGQLADAYQHLRLALKQPEYERDRETLNQLAKLWIHGKKTRIIACWNRSTIECSYPITVLCLLKNSKIAAGIGGEVELWDWDNSTRLVDFGSVRAQARVLQTDTQERYVLAGWEYGTMRIWRLDDAEPICLLKDAQFDRIVVNPEWTYALSCGKLGEQTIFIWDLEISERVAAINTGEPIVGLTIPAHSNEAIVVLESGRQINFDLANGRSRDIPSLVSGDKIRQVIFSDESSLALILPNNNDWLIFNRQTGGIITLPNTKGFSIGIWFDQDLHIVLANSKTFEIWSTHGDNPCRLFESERLNSTIESIAADKMGRFIFTGDSLGNLRCWEIDWELKF